ncbi:MAG: hypothetical protein HOB19_02610 [Elusimicrobiaceae bacterium]|jgi:hypothetical protein|nr:hypothetical protein [Elusimicrobiaceae bacterium]
MKRPGKIQSILLDYWEEYSQKHIVRTTEHLNVMKVLACRTPLLGKHVYKCNNCDYEIEVSHSCKSRFCSVCGVIATENWIAERFNILLDCGYHHVVVTVPAVFRYMIKMYRTDSLNLFSKCVADTIFRWAKQKGFEPGMVSFYHSFGSNLQFHPHFHFLVTAGGLTNFGKWKNHYSKMPPNILGDIFKAKFSAGIKNILRSKLKEKSTKNKKHNNKIYKAIYQTKTAFEKHWQFFTEAITRKGDYTMLYCVRYVKKMIISEKRIYSYDKQNKTVTFLSGKKEVLVYNVMKFIKCIVQHIPEKNFKHIKYYGLYANKSKKKYQIAKRYFKPFHQHGNKLTWKMRQFCRDGVDPFRCPICKTKMELKTIVYPLKSMYRMRLIDMLSIYDIAIQTKIKFDYG